MPTPVSAARQCLTAEAARALDEAVGVARRRGHAQTTSLHAVSAFLALPSSALREACARARSSAYSPRLQFKALELCFGVALDRLATAQSVEEPPISNSLMAAIKRSQANQRRHPESFHFLHQQQQQQQQQQQSLSCVKVELQQLIMSILDDPVVSRVFGEAGFRSCDIRLAIVRPSPSLTRYPPRSRIPPLFLCNLTGSDSELNRRGFSFPFSGFSGVSGGFPVGDDNCRRIGEVLASKKGGKNPLLVGVCADDAIRSFMDYIATSKGGVLPVEISGLSIICIEKEISEFIAKKGSDASLSLRVEELGRLAESCSGPGVVVNFGDLKGFIVDGLLDGPVAYVVAQLTRLLELHRKNLWLMGSAASYESYLKILTRYPSIEKDWDLQLLPITSLRPSMEGSTSLMESFVPFGGFFSTPSDLKGPSNSSYPSLSCCHLCNEKCEREVSDFLKGGCSVSVADRYRATLPPWLQTAELNKDNILDVAKVKDDGAVLNAKVMELKRKWNDICRRLRHIRPMPETDVYRVGSQGLPGTVGYQRVGDGEVGANNRLGNSTSAPPNKSGCENVYYSTSMDLQKISPPKQNMQIPVVSEAKNHNFLSKLQVIPSKTKNLQTKSLRSPPYPLPDSSMPDDHASPSSATSVTTDLGLGFSYASTCKELKKPTFQAHKEYPPDSSGSFPDKVDVVIGNISNPPAQPSSCCGSNVSGQFDPGDLKKLRRDLTEKVGRQYAAICGISQTVAHCRTENGRRPGGSLKGDIWLNFIGPDRIGKKRIAMALAEILFDSRENLISVDLSFQGSSNKIIDFQEKNGYDVKFRGKTIVDYIAGELCRKPRSVVFLENVDKADIMLQNSLSKAIRTGKFSDLLGKEVSINNTVFVTTSKVTEGGKTCFTLKEPINFSEERILGAQGWQMRILIRCVPEDTTRSSNSNVLVTSGNDTSAPLFGNKRKLISDGDPPEQHETFETAKRAHKVSNSMLDLNLPVEENEENDTNYENYDSDSISENSVAWLDDFLVQVDATVVFEPFDFDTLAATVLKEISKCFERMIGSEGLLEIDSKAMEQILAATWLSERKRGVEDWVEQVLGRSFAEARQSYGLTARSVLKLVTCEGLYMEEQAPGVCLPSRIILN